MPEPMIRTSALSGCRSGAASGRTSVLIQREMVRSRLTLIANPTACNVCGITLPAQLGSCPGALGTAWVLNALPCSRSRCAMKLEQEVRHKSEDIQNDVLLDVVRAIRRRVRVVNRQYDIPY